MCRRLATLLLEIPSPNSLRTTNRDAWYQYLLTPYVASMVCSALEMFKQYGPGQRNYFWLRQLTLKNYSFFYGIEEYVSENQSDYFWTEMTRSIYRVTSCEFMERRKCKRSVFSIYVSNFVGCLVVYMYLSTKIYDKEANLASWYRSFMGS